MEAVVVFNAEEFVCINATIGPDSNYGSNLFGGPLIRPERVTLACVAICCGIGAGTRPGSDLGLGSELGTFLIIGAGDWIESGTDSGTDCPESIGTLTQDLGVL